MSATRRKAAPKADVDSFYDIEMELLSECVKAFARDHYRRRMVFGTVTRDYRSHNQEQRIRVLRYLRDRFVGKDHPL